LISTLIVDRADVHLGAAEGWCLHIQPSKLHVRANPEVLAMPSAIYRTELLHDQLKDGRVLRLYVG
jgi:hypothetical protein